MTSIIKKIKHLSTKEPKTLEQMALKLSEESGEVSQAVLSYTNASGNKYKKLDSANLKQECIDTILVATALYYKLENSNDEEFLEILQEKMNKWEQHINN
ncbi:MAG: MazG-like family protein [Vagococcus sp.]|uniref:MazG-like family protein n=1 Tax=Vagococcus sp. TaxID=1933889 RepID=UPI002FCB19E9